MRDVRSRVIFSGQKWKKSSHFYSVCTVKFCYFNSYHWNTFKIAFTFFRPYQDWFSLQNILHVTRLNKKHPLLILRTYIGINRNNSDSLLELMRALGRALRRALKEGIVAAGTVLVLVWRTFLRLLSVALNCFFGQALIN